MWCRESWLCRVTGWGVGEGNEGHTGVRTSEVRGVKMEGEVE